MQVFSQSVAMPELNKANTFSNYAMDAIAFLEIFTTWQEDYGTKTEKLQTTGTETHPNSGE